MRTPRIKATHILATMALGALATRTILDRKRWYDYAGKLVVISGGARGLGLILARQLIRRGARVAICARDEAELARALEHLAQLAQREGRGDVFGERCDVRDPHNITTFLTSVRAWGGPIDVMINNAGIITIGPSNTMLLSDYEEAFDVHLRGPLNLIQGVLPDMKAAGSGRIVNIASFAGVVSLPHAAPYCASKHALVGLSDTLRTELTRDNIFVTTVNPGIMRTGSHVNARFKGAHEIEQTIFSLANANPLISVNAERAARKILEGAARGRARVTVGWAAYALGLLDRVAPETVIEALTAIERLIPHPHPLVSVARSGRRSASALSPSFLTALSDREVERNFE